MTIKTRPTEHDAWNPGWNRSCRASICRSRPCSGARMFRPAWRKRYELSDYCGLPVHELVAFRAERLIVHELLIRVTAKLSVPDGTKYRDLGANFRAIASTILKKYIAPHREELAQVFEQVKSAASAMIVQELAKALSPDPRPASRGRRRSAGGAGRSTLASQKNHRAARWRPPKSANGGLFRNGGKNRKRRTTDWTSPAFTP